ncbi:MAG: hypothetical protein KIT37_06540, partial [Steroidobacteraceae bacterium]|nr:hypothetical protein [Steroidobacteraceae bacterium]
MKHRTLTGRILYTSCKPGREGAQRGYESFIVTRHTDGRTTIRAHCAIEEPEPAVLRDVIYSLDENDRPLDCHVRLTVDDRFMGSGWFRMTPGTIECESHGPAIGRVSQVVAVDDHYDGFGTHPIVGDGYFTRCIDVSKGPHRRQVRAFMPSGDHRGATPPLITEARLTLEYVGEETVTVTAGTFT